MAIVGGGPVGLGLAIELGQRGVACILVERHETPHLIPKGQNLTQRTMEHFRCWGVEDEVRGARVMPPEYPNSGVVAYRNLMGEYSHPWWRRSVLNDYYFARNERLPQYETERVLRARVASLAPVEALFGWTATRVAAEGGGVSVEIERDGRRRSISAEWLVGCDGSRSMVRSQAGISEDRREHERRMILAVFRSTDLHRLLSGFGEAAFFKIMDPALDGYWKFLGRVDVGESWFFHAPVGEDASDDPAALRALLHDAVGAEFELELDHVGFWDLRIAVARAYRRGRVFLAGDAAHSHPPYGGYGINTGFEDARNLGWKLAAALEGWGSELLLDSYEQERLPVFRSTATDLIESFIREDREFLARHRPEWDRDDFERAWTERGAAAGGVVDFEPHYEGSPLVFGPEGARSGAVGEHSFLARPGHHLPPVELSGGRDLLAELGAGFGLIALGLDPGEVARWRRSSAGIPFSVVMDDLGGTRRRYGSRMVLVRPDHYVGWAGEPPGDPWVVLARVVGRGATAGPPG